MRRNAEKRGRNKEFMIGGIKAIFHKNWSVDIDSHEIDLSLTYGENFSLLMDKYVYRNISLEEL